MSNLSDTGNLMCLLVEEMITTEEASSELVREVTEALKIDPRNWIPVLVVETGKYPEDEQYTVILGTAWVAAARSLGIERLWAVICPESAISSILKYKNMYD